MNGTRRRVARCVRATPGIHFNELVRTLDLAPGQVQYHLKRLIATDSVVDEQRYGRTHYFTPEVDDWERGALSLVRRETAGDVVAALHDRGPMSPGALADVLDVARSTLEWHLDHLAEQDVVRKDRDERNRVTLVLTRPDETAALLRTVQPSTASRMVDRFTRLADHLLDDADR
ncbi:helix-turn-helix domain-containing protein [Halococcus sp. IIIV-5B]|uniref:winged helix-turn-helix transcriptional regulator n=1 Tax=Halococcus sp. IIIV-5B TaxID=2321230 RepID=UPI000E738F2F|nr:helix-turn-helix domain-containing protein [Halococcus sp. IIIV-5B]RJT03159.1 winged helix-turn-helix transcriptional regulator [Halococcus sp. IIIV-5B]